MHSVNPTGRKHAEEEKKYHGGISFFPPLFPHAGFLVSLAHSLRVYTEGAGEPGAGGS